MSDGIKKSLIRTLTHNAVESAWIQWAALGARITTPRPAQSMVDPEALVLISMALRDHERRLWEVLASWAERWSTALSVQRIKNLRESYPEPIGPRVAELAWIAFEEGGDHRWRNLAGKGAGPRRRGQDLARPVSKGWDPAALVVRLRLGIGVGLQADVLAFLLAQQEHWVSARDIVDATGYTVYAIRRTADKMAEARLIESTAGKPVKYRADRSVWSGVLGSRAPVVPWRHWHQVYALVAGLVSLVEGWEPNAPTPYLQSTRLRDFTENHLDAFRLSRLSPPEAGLQPREYLNAFASSIEALGEWIQAEA
jgi:hypothetical protein